jgi:hypothetical protein
MKSTSIDRSWGFPQSNPDEISLLPTSDNPNNGTEKAVLWVF